MMLMLTGVTRWRCTLAHLANMTAPSMCGGDMALCQISLTTRYYLAKTVKPSNYTVNKEDAIDCCKWIKLIKAIA